MNRNQAKLAADGTLLRGLVQVDSSPASAYNPSLVSNGAGYAVDWAWNEQTACQSLWASTKPITLMMTKNADGINANLDWTNVDINEYVVYRSPSPQTADEGAPNTTPP